MTSFTRHGFVLWGVPRFQRQLGSAKPPAAPQIKTPSPPEPAPPPKPMQVQDETKPEGVHAA